MLASVAQVVCVGISFAFQSKQHAPILRITRTQDSAVVVIGAGRFMSGVKTFLFVPRLELKTMNKK